MTGEQLAELMIDDGMKAVLAKHARRYSKRIENQEEFIQDAWLRIANQDAGLTHGFYGEQGRKAIYASWKRRYRRRVDK